MIFRILWYIHEGFALLKVGGDVVNKDTGRPSPMYRYDYQITLVSTGAALHVQTDCTSRTQAVDLYVQKHGGPAEIYAAERLTPKEV